MRQVLLAPVLVGAAILVATIPTQAAAKYDSWQGKWALNLAESHYPATFPKITRNDITVTKDDGKVLQFTETVTMDGKDVTGGYDGAYDGKMRPTSDGQQLAFHHVSAKTIGDERKNAAGVTTGKSACTFSDDGKKLTCHITTFMKPGEKPLKFVEVFDRVE